MSVKMCVVLVAACAMEARTLADEADGAQEKGSEPEGLTLVAGARG